MSELKAVHAFDVYEAYTKTGDDDAAQVYLKSEADKVIAELEDKLKVQTSIAEEGWKEFRTYHTSYAEAVKELYEKNKELRRQKYKRCLAMAKLCEERYNYLTCLENWQMTDKEYQQVIGDYWDRWNTSWLKIAEQFKDKEAK